MMRITCMAVLWIACISSLVHASDLDRTVLGVNSQLADAPCHPARKSSGSRLAGGAPARTSATTSGKDSATGNRAVAEAAWDAAPTGAASPLRASRAAAGRARGSLMPFLRVRRRPWQGPALRPGAAGQGPGRCRFRRGGDLSNDGKVIDNLRTYE